MVKLYVFYYSDMAIMFLNVGGRWTTTDVFFSFRKNYVRYSPFWRPLFLETIEIKYRNISDILITFWHSSESRRLGLLEQAIKGPKVFIHIVNIKIYVTQYVEGWYKCVYLDIRALLICSSATVTLLKTNVDWSCRT